MVEAVKEKPFAMHFKEPIPEEEITVVGGSYNEQIQKWDWPTNEISGRIIASFPGQEKPPTVSGRPTRIGPTTTRVDNAADD